MAAVGQARVARPSSPRLAGPPLRGAVQAPKDLKAVDKAIKEGFLQKSTVPVLLDGLGSIRNEVSENDCIGDPSILPANLIGAGPGKPGIDVLAGNGILDAGNTCYVVNLGKSVQFAAGVNGSPVRPVITLAVDDGQGAIRVKGRVSGNVPGKTVYVEINGVFPIKIQGGLNREWVTQLNLVWGEADAVGNFDFDALVLPDLYLGFPPNVVAKVTRGKNTSLESAPRQVELKPVAPPAITIVGPPPGRLGEFKLAFDAPGGISFGLQAAPDPVGPWHTFDVVTPPAGAFNYVILAENVFPQGSTAGFLRLTIDNPAP